jgi:hypothetical protein
VFSVHGIGHNVACIVAVGSAARVSVLFFLSSFRLFIKSLILLSQFELVFDDHAACVSVIHQVDVFVDHHQLFDHCPIELLDDHQKADIHHGMVFELLL